MWRSKVGPGHVSSRRFFRFEVAVGTLILVTGCAAGTAEDEDSADDGASASPDVPALLTWDGPVEAGHDANASGTLGVNDHGCVTVGGRVLVAPPGSEIDADGSTLRITGYPETAIGEELTAAGGHFDHELESEWADCLDDDGGVTLVNVGPVQQPGAAPENPVTGDAATDGPTVSSTPSSAASEAQDAVERVANSLDEYYDHPGYGMVSVDYDQAKVTVLWKGDPPQGVAALEGIRPNGVTVVIGQATYSEHELAAVARRLVDAPARDLDGAKVSAAMPNRDRSGIVVEVVRPWDGDETGIEDLAGVPITVRLVDEMVRPSH